MTGSDHDVLLLGTEHPGEEDLPRVAGALGARFQLVVGRSTRVARSWLDTADRRLDRAGLVLEQRRVGRHSELLLSDAHGIVLATRPGAVQIPLTPRTLGASELASLVRPILGVRSLLVTAAATVDAREISLLDAERKTVARITLETPLDHSAQGSRVEIRAVRGYLKHARSAHSLIAELPGAMPGHLCRLDDAVAPGADRDHPDSVGATLDPRQSSQSALAHVLLAQLAVIDSTLEGTISALDTEFLHDLRVAVRRTRSALKLLGDLLPAGLAARIAPEFKWLGDITTPVRDLDVQLIDLDLDPSTDPATAVQRGQVDALDPWRALLQRRRRAARRALVTDLRSERFTTLTASWRAALQPLTTLVPTEEAGTEAAAPIAEILAARVDRAHRRVLKHGTRISAASPAVDLHDLRKRCKELRALLDLFANLLDERARREVSKQLKVLQDCLGDFQDSEVQAAAITIDAQILSRSLAAPAATLLAMGARTERLDVRRSRAREEFADIFTAFTASRTAARMRVLTAAPSR